MLDNIIMDIDDIPLTENDKTMIKHETSEEDLVSLVDLKISNPPENSIKIFVQILGRNVILTNQR